MELRQTTEQEVKLVMVGLRVLGLGLIRLALEHLVVTPARTSGSGGSQFFDRRHVNPQ